MVNYVFFVDFAMPVSVLVHFQEMMRRNQNNIVFIIQFNLVIRKLWDNVK